MKKLLLLTLGLMASATGIRAEEPTVSELVAKLRNDLPTDDKALAAKYGGQALGLKVKQFANSLIVLVDVLQAVKTIPGVGSIVVAVEDRGIKPALSVVGLLGEIFELRGKVPAIQNAANELLQITSCAKDSKDNRMGRPKCNPVGCHTDRSLCMKEGLRKVQFIFDPLAEMFGVVEVGHKYVIDNNKGILMKLLALVKQTKAQQQVNQYVSGPLKEFMNFLLALEVILKPAAPTTQTAA